MSEKSVATLARIKPVKRRQAVRVTQQFRVELERAEELVTEYAQNLSAGGMFVRTRDPAPLDSVINVTLALPFVDREIAAKARVVHIVEHGQASAAEPGMGVEFIGMSKADFELLGDLVGELRGRQSPVGDQKQVEWVLGIGQPRNSEKPGLVARNNYAWVCFDDPKSANQFLDDHHVAFAIVHESVLTRPAERNELAHLMRKLGRRAVFRGSEHAIERIAGAFEGVTVEPSASETELAGVVGPMLRTPMRLSERVGCRTEVSCTQGDKDFLGRMVDISESGMLFCSEASFEGATELFLFFDLPNLNWLFCTAEVVRVVDQGSVRLIGVRFTGLSNSVREAIQTFIKASASPT